jgi:hypothetical protein
VLEDIDETELHNANIADAYIDAFVGMDEGYMPTVVDHFKEEASVTLDVFQQTAGNYRFRL